MNSSPEIDSEDLPLEVDPGEDEEPIDSDMDPDWEPSEFDLSKAADRLGLRVVKSKRRNKTAPDFNRYRVEDKWGTVVVAGRPNCFTLTPKSVDSFLKGLNFDYRDQTVASELARRVRFWRGEITISDLAEDTGFSEQFIEDLEAGKATPTLFDLVHLAESIGTSLVELLKGLSPSLRTPWLF